MEYGRSALEHTMSVVKEEEEAKVLRFEIRTRINHWEPVYLKIRNSFMLLSYTNDFNNCIFKNDLLKIKTTVFGLGDSSRFVIKTNDKDKFECRAKSNKMQTSFVEFINKHL